MIRQIVNDNEPQAVASLSRRRRRPWQRMAEYLAEATRDAVGRHGYVTIEGRRDKTRIVVRPWPLSREALGRPLVGPGRDRAYRVARTADSVGWEIRPAGLEMRLDPLGWWERDTLAAEIVDGGKVVKSHAMDDVPADDVWTTAEFIRSLLRDAGYPEE